MYLCITCLVLIRALICNLRSSFQFAKFEHRLLGMREGIFCIFKTYNLVKNATSHLCAYFYVNTYRIRKAPEAGGIKLQHLEMHFKEIQIREERCIGFLLNVKDDFIMLYASRDDQMPFRMTWDQLSKKYLPFL